MTTYIGLSELGRDQVSSLDDRIGSVQLSVVIPVFNEKDALPGLLSEVLAVCTKLEVSYEVIVIDDSSTDGTKQLLLEHKEERVRPILLEENVGHQAALAVGLRAATGEFIVTMDGDGQHDPEHIEAMVKEIWSDPDLQVVQMVHRARTGMGFLPSPRELFYWIVPRATGIDVPLGQADFRLVTSVARELLLKSPEVPARVVISKLNLKTQYVAYSPRPRLFGSSTYGLRRRVLLALSAIFASSTRPLLIAAFLGVAPLVVALLGSLVLVADYLLAGTLDSSWLIVTAIAWLMSFPTLILSVIAVSLAYFIRGGEADQRVR